MATTGAHRVTIDSTTVNLWTPTALDGVVNTDNDWTASDQSSHENLQKLSRQLMRFPPGAIENLVEGAEGFALGVTCNPETRRYGSLARCQQYTHHKNERFLLGSGREGSTKRVQSVDEKVWNDITGFSGEINMFHGDLFSLEPQSGMILHRSIDGSSLA